MNTKKNLLERLQILSKAKNNPELQAVEITLCKKDILYFFDYYLYTDKNDTFFWQDFNQEVPFILFDFQREAVVEIWNSIINGSKPVSERDLEELNNVFIEKSRQMWISWLIVWIFLYWFLFYKHKYTLVSRTAAEVDSQWDMDSMFEKLRFMIRNLPSWMLPEWFPKQSWNEHNKYMNISDPYSSASITWKTANPDAWRWGTRNAIFLDEMAFMQYAQQINRSAASNTPCRIFNSTPNWEWNEFYRMKLEATKWNIKWLRYHWSEHPYYDDKWYNQKIKGMTKETIAQELEIDYNTAIVWRVYPEFKYTPEKLNYRPLQPLYISIDNSHWWADPHSVIVAQTDNQTWFWYIIDTIEINCSVTSMAELMSWVCKIPLNDLQQEFFERFKTYNTKSAIFISDPYDTHSTLNNSTIFQEYQKVWIYLNIPQNRNKVQQIQMTRSNILKYKISENCVDFASAIINAKYPEIKETTNSTSEHRLPVHNWTSHYRTSLEYLTTYLIENELTKVNKIIDDRPVRDYLTWEIKRNFNLWKNSYNNNKYLITR